MAGPPPVSHCTLVHEPTWEQCLGQLANVARLGDHVEAIEWAVATNPTVAGQPITPSSQVRVRKTSNPSLRAFYTHDGANECSMLWIEEAEEDEAEDQS